MKTTPSISIGLTSIIARLSKTDTAKRLRDDAIIPAARTLANLDAWPCLAVETSIRIVEGFDTLTDVSTEKSSPDGKIRRPPGSKAEILIGADFFVAGYGGRMMKLGAARDDVTFHALAHEIHHLDEVERMAKCGIHLHNCRTALAGAVRPEFPGDWKAAFLTLTETFPRNEDIPAPFETAFHIANEAAADLVGLHWMRAAGKPWETYASKLVELREQDMKAWREGRLSTKPYDIGGALAEILASGLPASLDGIHSTCWERAMRSLIDTKLLPHPLGEIIPALQALTHDPSATPARQSKKPGPG